MLTMVHCADLHAGRPAPSLLQEEKAAVRRGEVEGTLRRIVDFTSREKADLLLISGDLFEHSHASPAWAREASSLFESIPGTRVFVAPGNHDPVVRGSFYKSLKWPPNVTVFDSPEIREVLLPDLPVAVYGYGWSSFTERREVLKGFAAERADRVSVLVVHGDAVTKEASQYLPISPPDMEKSGLDYIALGHIHAPSEFRWGPTVAAYPGCTEPLDFGDKGQRGVYLVKADEDAPKGERVRLSFVPMAARQMRSVDLDITGLDTPEKVRRAVLSCGTASDRKTDMWAVRLCGSVEPEVVLDIPSLERDLAQDFFALRLIPEYRPSYDLEALGDPSRESLEARFVRHLLEKRRAALDKGDETAAETAERALYYGLDAMRQGRVLLRKGGQR